MSWHPNNKEIFISYGGGIHSINIITLKAKKIKFNARVKRQIKETVRFKVDVAKDKTSTRSHRWSQKTPAGILYEALKIIYKGGKYYARKKKPNDTVSFEGNF